MQGKGRGVHHAGQEGGHYSVTSGLTEDGNFSAREKERMKELEMINAQMKEDLKRREMELDKLNRRSSNIEGREGVRTRCGRREV